MPAPRPTYSRDERDGSPANSSVNRPDTSQDLDRTNKVSGAMGRSSAREAYDRFAPVYDEFNSANNYELWLGELLLPRMEELGLKQPGRALDVGCGTGKAFEPLLRRGWSIIGLDVSAEMLARAEAKLPTPYGYKGEVELAQCDARALLPFVRPSKFGGPHRVYFDLILSLNDVVNYLTEDGDLERLFSGMRTNLAPGGFICFDTNTLGLMRNNFAGPGMDRGEWTWRGSEETVEPGGVHEAIVSGPRVIDSVHRQRHWTEEEVRAALDASGLRCLARLGHYEDADWAIRLMDEPDEERDLKAIYVAGHR